MVDFFRLQPIGIHGSGVGMQKEGDVFLMQSKSVAPSFSLDYICTEGALMKTADTLGYLIRV